jgi:alanine-glyoxylate transaminase/serine-glyoxylate transaminase/serine-pyruvate transaminase
MTNKSIKLLIPGPVEVSPAVLKAMGSQVRPHYGGEWTAFYTETQGILKKVFNTQGDVYIMPGSGTLAIDTCIGSALCTGDKIIIGTNGFFGDRLVSIAEGNGLRVVKVAAEWGKPILVSEIEKSLAENPDVKALAVVHLETSTTVQNPIEKLGAIAHKYSTIFIVDAVSSLGGVPFSMDDWGIDLCASASQKCLGAPPGLAPVAVGKNAWSAIDRNPNKAHGWYTDLKTWRKYQTEWGDWHPSPVTMPTNNIYALRASLDELLAEGISTRLERYRKLALKLRAGFRKVGILPFTADDQLSPVLTAGFAPEGVSSLKIVDYLLEEYGLKISSGLGALKEKIFRVGHMSPVTTEADIDRVIEALGKFQELPK